MGEGERRSESIRDEWREWGIRREESKKHVAKGTDASVDLNIMTMTRYQARSMLAITFF